MAKDFKTRLAERMEDFFMMNSALARNKKFDFLDFNIPKLTSAIDAHRLHDKVFLVFENFRTTDPD